MRKQKQLIGWVLGALIGLSSMPAMATKKVPTSKACIGKKWSQAHFSHRIYSHLLKRYVRNGRVNYNGLASKRNKLDIYLCRLAHSNVKFIKSRRARFAFWINAYNAVTLRAVLDRIPKSRAAQKNFSVAAGKWNFWKGWKYQVNKRWYTLDQIENKIIRPRFGDARLHFALVCAARGCPHLVNKAYTGKRLYSMLNRNSRKYLRSANGCKVNKAAKVLHLSKLFQWYRKDFVSKKTPHPALYAARFLKKADRQFVRKHYKSLKIKWIPYSWKLNVQ